MNNKLFVYGSLRTGFFNYDKYLKGHVISCEEASAKGILYHMPYKGYPAIQQGEGTIYGELITVDNPEEVIKAIDEMEGFISPGNPENEYDKIEVEVTILESNEKVMMPLYFYNKAIDEKFEHKAVLISDGDWKAYMNSKKAS
ncbi:MAG: gamma-glutamylcyclotransferase family protein [Clostridium sp.]